MSFFGELRRRNVVKVGAAYAIVGWLLIEVSSTVLPTFEAPLWVLQTVTFVIILGFPLALILAWIFDLTRHGVERTAASVDSGTVAYFTGRTLDFTIIGALVLALGYVAVDSYVFDQAATSREVEYSVAALPFSNESAAEENAEFIANGMHDELLTRLADISALRVISRTSVMEYRDTTKNMRQIGAELGVENLLEGRVQRAGDMLRINVQLIKAETDEHIWQQIYNRELSAENIFAIQSEMATAIAAALEATLLPEEAARLSDVPTESTRALEFYLSGNEYARLPDNDTSNRVSAQLYQQAVDEDPDYALAWAALARSHTGMYFFGLDRNASRLQMAESALERAFELSPNLPEAHLARGSFYYQGLRDYDRALEELAIAERGMPRNAELLQMRSFVLRRMGSLDQSIATMEQAIELDPRSIEAYRQLALTYLLARDYENSAASWDRLLQIAPDYVPAYTFKAELPLFRDGDFSLAKSMADNPPIELGSERNRLGWQAAIFERDYETALSYTEGWELDPEAAVYRAQTYQWAGEPELAVAAYRAARVRIDDALSANSLTPFQQARLRIFLGGALVGLGESEAGMRMARSGMELMPRSTDAQWGAYTQALGLLVLAAAGDNAATIEELDDYLSNPGGWAVEAVSRNPAFDSIHDDPRFQTLIEKYRRR